MEQLLPFLVVGFFPVFWAAISLLLLVVGGWATLAKHYRAREDHFGDSYWLRSGAVGTVRYGSCLNLQISEEGLRLSVFFLFRIGHPPLFIPWSEFQNIRETPHWFLSPRFIEADIGDAAIAHIMLAPWVFDHLPAKMKTP